MMEVIIRIGAFFLQAVYSLCKLFPVKKKVVFLSRQHDSSNSDFDLLIKQLKEDDPEIECVVLAKMIHGNILSKLSYVFHIFVQLYHLATSQVAILDTYCIPVSLLHHRDSLTVIQIWHAVGAFKKFGYSILGKEEGSSERVAKAMRMHDHYDYVCTSSEAALPSFAEAFHTDESHMIIYPLPHLDQLKDPVYKEKRVEEIYKEYPSLNGNKKIILYAPTFRKDATDMNQVVTSMCEQIDFQNYELIVKLHPLTIQTIDQRSCIIDRKFTTADMLFVSDYVITDYSAIVFEAAFLNKPLYFYTFDYDTYLDKRDFYLDYEKEMPGLISDEFSEIMDNIEQEKTDLFMIRRFSTEYITAPKESFTKDLACFIEKHIR